MAKQIDQFTVIIQSVRQGDGTYVVSMTCNGAVSDPAATNQVDQMVKSIPVQSVAWDGALTGAVLRTACFDVLKTASGTL